MTRLRHESGLIVAGNGLFRVSSKLQIRHVVPLKRLSLRAAVRVIDLGLIIAVNPCFEVTYPFAKGAADFR
jgi:hypothetical protein